MNDFEEYKKLGEPDKRKKAENWGIAIGLQQVDGLTPSKYLFKIAKDNIEGKLSIDDAGKQIAQYYKENPAKTIKEKGEQQADEVSSRIANLLSTDTFSLTPAEYISIHKFLFTDILDSKTAGKVRKYDIIKDEPILNGDTVVYGRAESIKETLAYDISQEKVFDYRNLTKRKQVEHITKFISGVWQIHPFGEGNTRTTAVFVIKYLHTLGFQATNELFEKHALYFRNALVRANYQNLPKHITYTFEYLNKFFGNLLLEEKNKLDNRDMQITDKASSATPLKSSKKSSKKSSEKIFDIIKKKPAVTLQELAETTGLSVAGVRKNIDKLREQGRIKRIGPDKGGHWAITVTD